MFWFSFRLASARSTVLPVLQYSPFVAKSLGTLQTVTIWFSIIFYKLSSCFSFLAKALVFADLQIYFTVDGHLRCSKQLSIFVRLKLKLHHCSCWLCWLTLHCLSCLVSGSDSARKEFKLASDLGHHTSLFTFRSQIIYTENAEGFLENWASFVAFRSLASRLVISLLTMVQLSGPTPPDGIGQLSLNECHRFFLQTPRLWKIKEKMPSHDSRMIPAANYFML